MKISFYTLGCKLNQAETEDLKNDLINRGFDVRPWGEKTDAAVVRACGVTGGASQTTREMIRQAKRRGAFVITVGCLENNELKEIDFAAKNNEEVMERLRQRGEDGKPLFGSPLGKGEEGRTRALVKIQTGCNFNCAYCVIPSFRGKSRSVPINEIIEKIKRLEDSGFKEITLTGVNILQFKIEDLKFANLLDKILQTTGIPRVRLGSLDPRLVSDDLIGLYSWPKNLQSSILNLKLMPHWHLSLQSGSDAVLKRMGRGYTTEKYFNIIKKLRAHNPLFSFTTDVIVGFPGETEADFKQTCAFVKKCQFAKAHVFPFSARPGTPAAAMPDQVPEKIKKERAARLKKIAEETAAGFKKQFIGQTRPVLWENKKTSPNPLLGKEGGFWEGYTPEYLRVRCRSKHRLNNVIKEIKIKEDNLL